MTGEPRILLATQSFGDGRASVLATDSLWRWRMSLPSDSRAPATFWQQLLLWLARSTGTDGVRFVESFTEATMNQPVTLTAIVTGDGAPTVTAIGPDNKAAKVNVQPTGEAGQWQITWTPTQTGVWEVTARAGAAEPGIRYVDIIAGGTAARDRADLPPDWEQMREIAAATGGELIQANAPSCWSAPSEPNTGQELTVHRQLLWNRWWLLLGCLGPYACELVLRRRWKLL